METPLAKMAAAVEARYRAIDSKARNERYEAHWWDHVSRVVANAALVALEEGFEDGRDVLLASALCHDIIVDASGNDDVRASSQECERLMVASGFSEADAELGASLVLATDRDVKEPETILERAIYTADKLDLFGVDGTVRLVVQEARRGITVREDLATRIAARQAEWLAVMRRFEVGLRLVEERARAAALVIDALGPVGINP